ncbi:helix-turn-helix domain-containing protein [Rhodococcus sp. 27YEA15]|uniref:helix-turn-helix domain-containing protein n=1 Tax=Rhodococcus sp. 27YEA15 TaxID=3156259 RepID=UPI003C79C599
MADPADTGGRTFGDFQVFENVVDGVTPYGAHRHPEHQIAWMSEGVMEIAAGGNIWRLHREHVVWLPGGVLHEMTLLTGGCMISAYANPDLRPSGTRWSRPMVLEMDDLTAQLLRHLCNRTIDDRRRAKGQDLLYDLLSSAPERHDVLAVPRLQQANVVATAILEDPADVRTLEEWARQLGVSSKTLMRAFDADTGLSFRQWRTRARLYASLDMLARGDTVNDVAARVGYETSSGFIAAFRAGFGTTPARYAIGSQSRADLRFEVSAERMRP